MKKILFSTLAVLAFGTLAAAETIQIKEVWKRNKAVRPNQVKSAGFFHDAKQTIFALQIAGLDKFAADRGAISIYWDADNNKSSGRFPGKSGFDYQLNVRLRKKQYDLLHWDDTTRDWLASNSSKGFQINGDQLIIALPSTLLDMTKPAARSNIQIALTVGKRRTDSLGFTADSTNSAAPVHCSYTPQKSTAPILKTAPAGKGIAVPVLYTGNGTVKVFGIFRDKQKVVFAVVAPKVQKGDTMLIYWNSDGDKNTGRFPGRLGVDVQFNTTLFEQTLKVLTYPPDQGGKHKKALTVYDDDFLIESKGNVLFVAFKNETMEQVKLAQNSNMEIVYTHGNQRERIQVKFDLTSPGIGFMPERLDFVRFGSLRQVREKKALAVPLANTAPGLTIWDCQAERFQESEPTPKFAPAVNAFTMQAAKGEKEHLFFAVERKTPFSNLKLTPGSFTGKSGQTISGADVSVKYADFIINDRNDRFTDVLLPAFPGRKVKRQFAVLSVTVPRNAAPGIYKGEVALELDGKKLSPIPVELEVFNFALPERAAFPTAFAIKQSRITERFRNRQIATDLFKGMHDQAHRMRYSVRLLGADPKLKLVNGKLQIDWRNYDKVKKEYNRRFHLSQFVPFQLGSHDLFVRMNSMLKKNYKNSSDPEFRSVWEQLVSESIRHHKEQNFMDNTLFIIWDEPYSRWDDIIYAAKVIRKHDPKLPIGIFIDKYQPALEKYIDIWLVSQPAIAQMRTAPGMAEKRVWLYNSGGMRDFRLPSSDLRGFYLLAWKYDIAGYLYSAINAISQVKFENGYYHNNYPAHTWMYVSNDGKELYDSWRQLLVADGLDDYDYLKIYADLLKKQGKQLPAWLTKKFPSFNKVDGSVVFAIDTVTEWQELRRRIAREITALQ